jgi:NAD(P)-dependent dehydrogenase (short-subunit alcohol dehydrogenase family)
MDVQGTSAIVTGGASGLGRATTQRLAANGVRVVVLDMQDEPGEALAKEIGGVYVHADVRDAGEVIRAVEAAKEMGPLRVLVNCAGVGWAARIIGRDGSYESAYSLDMFEKIVSTNLVGTFNCIRLVATAMSQTSPLLDNERGSIVNVASIAAFDGPIGQAAYCASKGGVVAMTLPVARDLAVVGIRVNTVAPGLVDTPGLTRARTYGNERAGDRTDGMKRDVLFPDRLGYAGEFANLAMELITNSYMNATVIRLDGGARLQPK